MAQELIDKIRAAAQAKGIDPDVALRIAQAESTLRPTAQAGTSSAGGLFQVVDKTWKEFGGNPKKKFDPDENIRVGTDIISSNTNYLRKILNRDPRPAEVYAAHYFGPTGAKSFLSAEPGTPMESLFPANVIKANPNLKGKTSDQVMATLEKKMGDTPASGAASAPAVPAASKAAPTRAQEIMEPALRSGMTAQAPAEVPDKLAGLGPGYQAALALSFLADTDDKEDRDIDREPGVAEKYLAELDAAPRPAALAGFSDISIKSPFETSAKPQMLARGGAVQHLADGGLPFVPTARVLPSARKRLEEVKAEFDRYNTQAEAYNKQGAAYQAEADAYNKAVEAYNAGPRTEEFTTPVPVAPSMAVPANPSMTSEEYTAFGQKANKSAKNRNLALQVASNPEQYGLSINRLFSEGGEVEPVRLTPQQIEQLSAREALEREKASRPVTVNPSIQRQGEAAKRLAAMRDVNTLPDPRTYAAVSGFLGTAPDEMGFSVMHPDREGIKTAGEAGFYTGTALQVAPVVGKASKMLAKLTGSAINDRMLAGESLTPGFNTPAPINFAVKPRGGTFGYTPDELDRAKPITKIGKLVQGYGVEARGVDAPDEVLEFLKTKAPKYFTTTYGTANDPLRTAFREQRIKPFGTDIQYIKPELIAAANRTDDVGNLQARTDLEKAYDQQTGINANLIKPEGSTWEFQRKIRQDISEKMGQEGVVPEFRNLPSINAFTKEEFGEYPISSEMLRRFSEKQDKLPTNLQRALQSTEPIYDASPTMALLQPNNVIEALQQVPANKLKNMSFPEALIQGTQALAPVRDYLSAVALAEKGAKVPRKALDMFTTPVVDAPSFGGQWVTLDKSVAAKMEGKLMNHSVGDYNFGSSYGTPYTGLPYGGKKAFDEGLVRVYSLRDDQGLPKVTVEMAKSDGGKGDTWNVTQIRGRFNSEPLPETRNEIFNLLDKIDSQDGLNNIKYGSYSKLPTGEAAPGTVVDWAKEYDLWKSSAE